jgi:hypothetical protein
MSRNLRNRVTEDVRNFKNLARAIILNGGEMPPTRPSQDEMGPDQIKAYLDSLDRLVQTVLPRGSHYVLVMASPTGKVNWVTRLSEASAADLLRQLAAFVATPADDSPREQTKANEERS